MPGAPHAGDDLSRYNHDPVPGVTAIAAWHRHEVAASLKRVAHAGSSEFGHPFCLLEDDTGIVFQGGPRGFPLVHDARVRPIWNAHAAVAALLVAHDVAPLAVDIAMTVRERRIARIKPTVVARPQDVADLMGNRNRDSCARVVHDEVGFVGIRGHAGRQSATRWVLEHQPNNVGLLLVPQLPDTREWPCLVDHSIEVVKVLSLSFLVIHGLGVYEPQAYVGEAAIAESVVGLLNGHRQ